MLLNDKIEQKIEQTDKRLQEELSQYEATSRAATELLQELQLSSQQISGLLNSPDQFTKENWEELQKLQKQLDEKLLLTLKAMQDPRKSKKTLNQTAAVQRHWLYVR